MAITELKLSQQEANLLIKQFKELVKKVSDTITEGSRGTIPVIAKNNNRAFTISYFYEKANIHINFHDVKTGLSLVRLNLNDSFHRNSDGVKVSGNRVNIFSETEYKLKNDGKTHMKAYPLPYDGLENTRDFLSALTNLLKYTNTDEDGKLELTLSNELDI